MTKTASLGSVTSVARSGLNSISFAVPATENQCNLYDIVVITSLVITFFNENGGRERCYLSGQGMLLRDPYRHPLCQ